jgi:hypothetical protein
VEITPSLKAALAELYFKESCDQQGFAYVRRSEIGDFKNALVFRKGAHSISVRMHEQVAAEVKEFARVFDCLVCRIGQKDKYDAIVANPLALFWAKTARNFTNDQLDALHKTRLQVAVFRIRDALAAPGKVETKWEIKSAKEWLDEIDEKREEVESDDDYL